jgi:hypothetical protein
MLVGQAELGRGHSIPLKQYKADSAGIVDGIGYPTAI